MSHATAEAATTTKISPKAQREALVLWKLQQLTLLAIQAGQLAQENGLRDRLRSFGCRLVQDHRQAHQQVSDRLCEDALRLDLPAAVPHFLLEELDSCKESFEALKPLHGDAFDRAFTSEIRKFLDQFVGDLEFQAGAISHTGVGRLVRSLLGSFRNHQQLAYQLET